MRVVWGTLTHAYIYINDLRNRSSPHRHRSARFCERQSCWEPTTSVRKHTYTHTHMPTNCALGRQKKTSVEADWQRHCEFTSICSNYTWVYSPAIDVVGDSAIRFSISNMLVWKMIIEYWQFSDQKKKNVLRRQRRMSQFNWNMGFFLLRYDQLGKNCKLRERILARCMLWTHYFWNIEFILQLCHSACRQISLEDYFSVIRTKHIHI